MRIPNCNNCGWVTDPVYAESEERKIIGYTCRDCDTWFEVHGRIVLRIIPFSIPARNADVRIFPLRSQAPPIDALTPKPDADRRQPYTLQA